MRRYYLSFYNNTKSGRISCFCSKTKLFKGVTLKTKSTRQSVHLHGFSEASETAYSAVVYLLITYVDDTPTIVIVRAKSKIFMLKRLSIPKLKLCGAHLLAKIKSALIIVITKW